MIMLRDRDTLLEMRAENPDAVILLDRGETLEAYVPGDAEPARIFRGWNRLLKAKLFARKTEDRCSFATTTR